MRIVESIYDKIEDDTVLCVGNFDGIHVAHQRIISKVVKYARENFLKSMVVTFKQHPLSVLNPIKNPKLLIPMDEKIKLIKKMGVNYIALLDFSSVRGLSAEKFIKCLCENYGMRKIICGFNFKFGYKNRGNIQYLESIKDSYNYEIDIVMPMKILNKKVSSTKIRTYIKFGEVGKASQFLGRLFYIKDTIIKGKQLGRQLGFPTANMRFNSIYCIPQNGVYATITEFKNMRFPSMTNIGYNPTFKNKYISIETNLLDFEGDLYDKDLKIYFLKKLRNEMLFNDVHSLVDQLTKDKRNVYEIAKKYFK